MSAQPWSVYAEALAGGACLRAVRADGRDEELDLARWLAAADAVDERLVERARGPVLDVGCGPGRHVHALARRGVPVLGLDASHAAVRIASAGGGEAVHGDVFTHGLELGVWETVLLLDGNVGIGGDVPAMLTRCGELLRGGGMLVVEAHPDPTRDAASLWRLRGMDGRESDPFPWSQVGLPALLRAAHDYALERVWERGGRWFVRLRSL
jgi:SAM-dependent methyltransferase